MAHALPFSSLISPRLGAPTALGRLVGQHQRAWCGAQSIDLLGGLTAELVMRLRRSEEDTKKYGAPLGQAILLGAAGVTAIGLGMWGE
jgi:hypothetical protein